MNPLSQKNNANSDSESDIEALELPADDKSIQRRLMMLTFGWFLAIGLLVAGMYANKENPIAFIANNGLNTFGDFLAGIFAPVAFLWLAAAVFLQSKELAAQRTELRLTRLEYRESREVMKSQSAAADRQAEEAKKQGDFLSAQNETMKMQTEIITVQAEMAKREAQRLQTDLLLDRSLAFFREYSAKEMSELRNKASLWIERNRDVRLHESGPKEEETLPLWVIARFFHNVWVHIRLGRANSEIAVELFGEAFVWWWVNYHRAAMRPYWVITGELAEFYEWIEMQDAVRFNAWKILAEGDLSTTEMRQRVKTEIAIEPLTEMAPLKDRQDVREFALNIIADVYGIEHNSTWHADLDSLVGETENNWFSARNRGCFIVVRDASRKIIACGGLHALDIKPGTADRLQNRYPELTNVCQIVRVYITDKVRRLGLGRKIAESLEVEAATLRYRTAYLHTDASSTAANAFWRDCGYREFGKFNYPSAKGVDTSVDFEKAILDASLR